VIKKFQDFLYPFLSGHSFENDDDLFLYIILSGTAVFTALVHAIMLVLFAAANIPVVAYINIVSVIIYIISFVLAQHRKYTSAGLLISLEILCYAATVIMLTGFYTRLIFYFFLVLVMQMTIPYAKYYIKGPVVGLSLILLLVQVYLEGRYVPPIDLGNFKSTFSYFNIGLTFFAMILELSIGNFIKTTIANYHELRVAALENQANTDPLTGLFNRRYADLMFDKIKKDTSDTPWCVAILDIDDFKKVNDTRGHSVGDEVLVELAAVLRQALRKTDMIFRWGGEEFLVLLENIEVDTVFRILEKIRTSLAASETLEKISLHVTVTIGAGIFDRSDVEHSIENCDKKLYIGKNNGKNQVVI
jgi:diguanylate cyclase (GGDEF)-like protein